jgi:hypothetical protein
MLPETEYWESAHGSSARTAGSWGSTRFPQGPCVKSRSRIASTSKSSSDLRVRLESLTLPFGCAHSHFETTPYPFWKLCILFETPAFSPREATFSPRTGPRWEGSSRFERFALIQEWSEASQRNLNHAFRGNWSRIQWLPLASHVFRSTSQTMRLPVIEGLIRRRILVNFRVDPEVMQRSLPSPFRPKLHAGYAIAGICLIRLEQIRPKGLPAFMGITSENAAHRIAVVWDNPSNETCEGVYIPRRDTGSLLNHVAGGRIFPGEHQLADFDVTDNGTQISMSIRARDDSMSVDLRAKDSDEFPNSSCFASLAQSSTYFEGGSVGYSATADCCRLDGIRLETFAWQVRPLAVDQVESSYFSSQTFPGGSVAFDHALIMRDVRHEWHGVEDLAVGTATV